MELLEEEDPDRYQSQFAKFIEKEIEGDTLQEMYQKAHEAVRGVLPCRAEWGEGGFFLVWRKHAHGSRLGAWVARHGTHP